MTRVLVCGGRDYANRTRICEVLDAMHGSAPMSLLIHGAANGADRMAGAWGRARGIDVQAFPADWAAHGASAGPKRNELMLAEGKPDLVVAFPGGRGTSDMVRRAKAAGVVVLEVKS